MALTAAAVTRARFGTLAAAAAHAIAALHASEDARMQTELRILTRVLQAPLTLSVDIWTIGSGIQAPLQCLADDLAPQGLVERGRAGKGPYSPHYGSSKYKISGDYTSWAPGSLEHRRAQSARIAPSWRVTRDFKGQAAAAQQRLRATLPRSHGCGRDANFENIKMK